MPEVTIRDLRTTIPLPAKLLLRTEDDLCGGRLAMVGLFHGQPRDYAHAAAAGREAAARDLSCPDAGKFAG